MTTLAAFALGATKAAAVDISTNIPGATSAASSPGAFVANFYTFALSLGGILAFGAIVYGGFKYAISAGNPSKQSDAKSWITDALWGLLLLFSAYLVLHTINPNLVNLNLPTLGTLNVPTGATQTQTTTAYLTKVAACIEKGTNFIICNQSDTPQSCAQIQAAIDTGQCDVATGCISVAKNCCGAKKGAAGC